MSESDSRPRPPFLIALPQGLCVSGVSLWAVRLASGLAQHGHPVGLIVHDEPAGRRRLEAKLPRDVRTFNARDLPPMGETRGDLSPFIAIYRDAVRQMADETGYPVVLSPNLSGDCYGVAAALCSAQPEIVRIVGWQHSDIQYDYRVLGRYEPIIAKFVGVSERITNQLRQRLPARAGDIVRLPYGVPAAEQPPRRPPPAGRPIRFVYTGRMEHHQKRILALPAMSDELNRRGVDHKLVLRGDGPAAKDIDRAIQSRPDIERRDADDQGSVRADLEWADVFVLASRFEGLSISMLEAMGRGCVPVVTGAVSGTDEAVQPGLNGRIVEVDEADDEQAVGCALAEAVASLPDHDITAMSHAAWRTVMDRFSLAAHCAAASDLIEAVAARPPRWWPADRPCAFSAPGAAGEGTVPADAATRMRSLLTRLAGRRIIIHGAGRHTTELGPVLAEFSGSILAIADDDRQRHGSRLCNCPIIDPHSAGDTGATDVVISSWLHEPAIWSRRAVYERQGLAVHRLYAGEGNKDKEPAGLLGR